MSYLLAIEFFQAEDFEQGVTLFQRNISPQHVASWQAYPAPAVQSQVNTLLLKCLEMIPIISKTVYPIRFQLR